MCLHGGRSFIKFMYAMPRRAQLDRMEIPGELWWTGWKFLVNYRWSAKRMTLGPPVAGVASACPPAELCGTFALVCRK